MTTMQTELAAMTNVELERFRTRLLAADHSWRIKDALEAVEAELNERARNEAEFEAEFLAERGSDYYYSGMSAADANFMAREDLAEMKKETV